MQSQSLPSPIIAPCSQYIPTYLHTKKKKPLASILEFNCPDWAVLAYFCCLCRARETEREQLSCCSKIERAENLEVIRFSWLSVYRSIACSYRSHFATYRGFRACAAVIDILLLYLMRSNQSQSQITRLRDTLFRPHRYLRDQTPDPDISVS